MKILQNLFEAVLEQFELFGLPGGFSGVRN